MTDARAITLALGGKWYGHYGVACCPAHDNTRTPALTLANGTAGLLVSCKAGCSFAAVMAALRGLGLVESGGIYTPPDPAQQAQRLAEQHAEAEKKSAQAFRLWEEGLPITGTLAETYLRARGITCALPDALRFAPSCWHATGKRFPAMLAMVEGGAGFALHRTYLREDGSGKAELDPSKAMLGGVKGGAVRLSESAGPLVVAEGIETALSLASGLLRTPAAIWAALSTSGMKTLALPAMPGTLIVASDGDEPGRGAAYALAERANALGWTVTMFPAPDGRDWNDVLTLKGAVHGRA